MNLGLMVKRVELIDNVAKYKGAAVSNITFSDTGVIFSWGEGDRFEICFEDFAMLQDVTRGVLNKLERERYLKNQGHNLSGSIAPVPSRGY